MSAPAHASRRSFSRGKDDVKMKGRKVPYASKKITLQKSGRPITVKTAAAGHPDIGIIADSLPVLAAYIDANRVYRYANRAYREWFGSFGDIIGSPMQEVLGEAAYAVVGPHVDAVLGGQPESYEARVPYRDGERIINAKYVPHLDASGTVQGFHSLVTDVTDLRKVENEIRALNGTLERKVAERTLQLKRIKQEDDANIGRLKNVIDCMPIGAVIADEKQAIMHANERFCRLFDLQIAPASLVGSSIGEVIAMVTERLAEKEAAPRRLREMLERREAGYDQEVSLGDGRMLMRDYVPVTVGTECRGHLLLYRDVTRERRIDASKSEFMSLASHQLRTPLTAIRWAFGRLEKMLGARLDDRERRILHEGRGAALRMADTISTMLSISRIESGSMMLSLADVKVAEVIEEVRKVHEEQYGRRGQQLYISCPQSLRMQTDASLLKEILGNLLSNAIKYSPDNARISLRARGEGGGVCIDVQDSGYGIPVHQHEKIFRKFFRADNVVQKVTEGTGLGLYLVSLLVSTLGGTIGFTSAEGSGTTFSLRFPSSQREE